MEAPTIFTSNLARFHKMRYDMAISHFDVKEYSAAKEIFIELSQDAFTPVIWKAFSYYMLAAFQPLSMANINLDHARRLGKLLQDEATRITFFREIESCQERINAAQAKEARFVIDKAPLPPWPVSGLFSPTMTPKDLLLNIASNISLPGLDDDIETGLLTPDDSTKEENSSKEDEDEDMVDELGEGLDAMDLGGAGDAAMDTS